MTKQLASAAYMNRKKSELITKLKNLALKLLFKIMSTISTCRIEMQVSEVKTSDNVVITVYERGY